MAHFLVVRSFAYFYPYSSLFCSTKISHFLGFFTVWLGNVIAYRVGRIGIGISIIKIKCSSSFSNALKVGCANSNYKLNSGSIVLVFIMVLRSRRPC